MADVTPDNAPWIMCSLTSQAIDRVIPILVVKKGNVGHFGTSERQARLSDCFLRHEQETPTI